MTEKEKLEVLEDIMDLDKGMLTAETLLDELDEWDSMTAISLVALMDQRGNTSFAKSSMSDFKIVADLLAYMS